jgi:hypothetical protein
MEKETEMQKKALECKIEELKLDLENESTRSRVWSKSQISEQDSSSIKVFEIIRG